MPGHLAIITPVEGSNLPDFGGGRPQRPEIAPPIHLPPLPPGIVPPTVWPPPLEIGGGPAYPIYVPVHPIAPGGGGKPMPEPTPPTPPIHSKPVPPGQIWPPLNPSDGVEGQVLLLVWVVGTDRYRWIVVDAPSISTGLPGAEPK